jgi:hypothetical protein
MTTTIAGVKKAPATTSHVAKLRFLFSRSLWRADEMRALMRRRLPPGD